MHMHLLIDQKRAEISRICQRHHIQRLEVFGSAARATDFDPATSDADFLVEFAPGAKRGLESYFALKADLEALLQRGVDLVEPATLRNPYLLAGVNSAREVVYAA
jgi:predicted nucleotidyltransferase